jgi:hypothetical protein
MAGPVSALFAAFIRGCHWARYRVPFPELVWQLRVLFRVEVNPAPGLGGQLHNRIDLTP